MSTTRRSDSEENNPSSNKANNIARITDQTIATIIEQELKNKNIDAFENQQFIIARFNPAESTTAKLIIDQKEMNHFVDNHFIYYCILKDECFISKGGFGTVYKAYPFNFKDQTVDSTRVVAAKYFNNVSNLTEANYSETEGKFLAEFYPLEKPMTITRDKDVIVTRKDQPAISFMEFLDGVDICKDTDEMTIHDALKNISFSERVQIIYKIFSFVDILHQPNLQTNRQAIVHGDLKGANIKVLFNTKTGEWDVKILDFGSAEEVADHLLHPNEKHLQQVGTESHMSPEVLNFKLGIKNDIYALVPVILLLLGGKNIYELGVGQKYIVDNFLQGINFADDKEYLIKPMLKFIERMQANYEQRPTAKEAEEFFKIIYDLYTASPQQTNNNLSDKYLFTLNNLASMPARNLSVDDIEEAKLSAAFDLSLPTEEISKVKSLFRNKIIWQMIKKECVDKPKLDYLSTIEKILTLNDLIETNALSQDKLKVLWEEIKTLVDKLYPDNNFVQVYELDKMNKNEMLQVIDTVLRSAKPRQPHQNYLLKILPDTPLVTNLYNTFYAKKANAEIGHKQAVNETNKAIAELKKYCMNKKGKFRNKQAREFLHTIMTKEGLNDKTILEYMELILTNTQKPDLRIKYDEVLSDILKSTEIVDNPKFNKHPKNLSSIFRIALKKEPKLPSLIRKVTNALQTEIEYFNSISHIEKRRKAFDNIIKRKWDHAYNAVVALKKKGLNENELANRVNRIFKTDPGLLQSTTTDGDHMLALFKKKGKAELKTIENSLQSMSHAQVDRVASVQLNQSQMTLVHESSTNVTEISLRSSQNIPVRKSIDVQWSHQKESFRNSYVTNSGKASYS